jgi:repressor LexA
MLTPRQRAAYDFIESFGTRRGYAPSYDEIRRHLGLASLNAVAKLITQLRRRGHLVPAPPNAKRWLEPVRGRAGSRQRLARRAGPGFGAAGSSAGPGFGTAGPSTIPLLGTIAAGRPIEPVESPEEIEVPASMLGTGERYALRVQGDSMIDDGIQDGDVVVVRRAQRADAGETVVAIVDGEATLKRFHPARGQVELRPANAALSPIRVRADRVEIRGVLVGLFRRYAP